MILLGTFFMFFLAFGVNFGAMIFGSKPEIQGFLATLAYVLYWGIYIYLMKKERAHLIYAGIFCGLTLLTAMIVLIINTSDFMDVSAIPMGAILIAIFSTPLYGLRYIFSEGFVSLSLVMASVSFVGMAVSCFFLRRRIRSM